MNMVEALTAIALPDSLLWCRPVSWKGTRQAYAYQLGRFAVVPWGSSGPRTALMPSVEEVAREWEVLDPAEVLKEGTHL